MRSKWIIALFAASALVPATAIAQDGRRGGEGRVARAERSGGGFDRSAVRQQRPEMRQQRTAPAARPDRPVNRDFARPNRQVNRDFARQRPDRAENRPMADRSRVDNRQQFQQQRREFNQGRGDARPGFRVEDRQAFRNGRGNREAFLRDRTRDQRDFRRDRVEDRRDFQRDRQRSADRRDWNGNRGRNWNGRDWNGGNRWNVGRGWNGRDVSGWDRGWRQDRRYDWRGYRHANRAVYRLPRYYPPQGFGFGYQRFGIGMTLGSVLFANNYWINDPWQYRLPPIDGPFRWVRYYNDALLVDIQSGEVVDVEYDVFW